MAVLRDKIPLTILAMLCIAYQSTLTAAQLQWELLHNGNHTAGAAPMARRDAGIVYDATRSFVMLFGGRGTKNGATRVFDDTWIFDIAKGTWREVESKFRPHARFSFVSGFSDGYMYISTGMGVNGIFLDDIWRFSMESEEWQDLPAQPKPAYYSSQQWKREVETGGLLKPEARYGSAGGVFSNSSRFYVSMGSSAWRYADAFSYSTHEKGWFLESPDRHPYSPSYPHARCHHAGTMISHEELIIYGGCLGGGGSGGPCPSGDSWIFDAKMKEWTQLPSCASPRTYASMAMLPIRAGQRRVVLYGGVEKTKQVITTVESENYQVAVLNPDTKQWTLRATQGTVPSKRASAAMVTGTNGIFVFGGINIGSASRMNNDLYLLRGDGETADQAPQSALCRPTFFNLVALHGILMILGWGFFLQWGAFIARFMDHKAPMWFHLHRFFQIFGLIIAIAGFVCGVLSVQFDHFKFTHAIIGLVVTGLGIFQPINGFLGPDLPVEGQSKSVKRVVWEYLHKYTGRSALIMAIVNISLGVFLAVSSLLLWSLWFAYVGVLILVYFFAPCNRKCTAPAIPAPAVSPSGKYILRDKRSNGLFAEHHHAYDNGALESEG